MDRLASLSVQADAETGAPAKRVTVLNNMVTPYTHRLYDRLHREGLAVSVVSCSKQEANRSWGEHATALYPHTVLSSRALHLGPGRYAHMSSGVGAALARTRPDFLFIGGFYPTMLTGAVWAALNRTPIGLITEGWRETMPNSLAHRVVRPGVLKRCRAVVTPGKKGAEYFRAAGVASERIFRVPLAPAWDMPVRVPGFKDRPYHLLWCAHLNDAQKNISFFLDVVAMMKRRLPDLAVRVVGKGELEALVLKRLRAIGVSFQHQVSVPWHDMAGVYASARVFLLPSVWEPWGIVCDEALQCGVPALVSPHVGAGDDVVVSGSNGYVLPLNLPVWVERALTLATDERTWTAFSGRARANAESRGLENSARAFLAMARQL